MWVPPPAALLRAGKWLLLLVANPNWLVFFKKLGVRVENKTLFFDVELYKKSTLLAKPPGLMPPKPARAPLNLAPAGRAIAPFAAGSLVVGAARTAIRNRQKLPKVKLPSLPRMPAPRVPAAREAVAPPPASPPPVVAAAAFAPQAGKAKRKAGASRAAPVASAAAAAAAADSAADTADTPAVPRSKSSPAVRKARLFPRRVAALTSTRALYGYLSLLGLSTGLMKPVWEHLQGAENLPGGNDPQLATAPLMVASVLIGHASDLHGRPTVLKSLAGASALTLALAAVALRGSAAKGARVAEGYVMLALPVVQAALADRTGRLLDRAALLGLLTASSALCMIGGSAAALALLGAEGTGSEVLRTLIFGAAAASGLALGCTAWMASGADVDPAIANTPVAATPAGVPASAALVPASLGDEAVASPDNGFNYRVQTVRDEGSPLRQPQPSPGWLFRGTRRVNSRISPSALAAGLLVVTTVSNPGTFFEVWDGVYNWHKLGGESLVGLAGAALVLVVVQAGLLRPLCAAAGGAHRLLCASHLSMALCFTMLMRVDGSSLISYPLLGAFFSAHSLVDSLTATLVSAYSPSGHQGLSMGINHAAHLILLPPAMSTLVMPFINCMVPILLFPPALRQIRSAIADLAAAIADT